MRLRDPSEGSGVICRQQRDPLRFLADALELLPRDPTLCTLDDLERLAAINQGLGLYVEDLAHRTAYVLSARRAEHATTELRELDAQQVACMEADRRMTTYSRRALQAHGIDLDRLAGRPTARRHS